MLRCANRKPLHNPQRQLLTTNSAELHHTTTIQNPHQNPQGNSTMGGGGVWDPKCCVPKMARRDFPNGKFRVFPLCSLWWGGGGVSTKPTPWSWSGRGEGSPPPPTVYGHSNSSLPNPQHPLTPLHRNTTCELHRCSQSSAHPPQHSTPLLNLSRPPQPSASLHNFPQPHIPP